VLWCVFSVPELNGKSGAMVIFSIYSGAAPAAVSLMNRLDATARFAWEGGRIQMKVSQKTGLIRLYGC